MWSAARERGHDLARLARWMATEPARLAGLDNRKGALAVGMDADFCLFDADSSWVVDPARLLTRHRLTPYAGRTVRGRVVGTWLRGERIVGEGATAGAIGRPLARAAVARGGKAR